MADKDQPKHPTHRAYSVIRREGQDDYWLNIGLVFPHKDGSGFNLMLQAFPLDGKIVCREIAEGDVSEQTAEARQHTGPQHSLVPTPRSVRLSASSVVRTRRKSRGMTRLLFCITDERTSGQQKRKCNSLTSRCI
jgi:hypothetical protein